METLEASVASFYAIGDRSSMNPHSRHFAVTGDPAKGWLEGFPERRRIAPEALQVAHWVPLGFINDDTERALMVFAAGSFSGGPKTGLIQRISAGGTIAAQ